MKLRMPSSTAVWDVRRTTARPHPTKCIVLFAIPRMSRRLAQWLELIHDKEQKMTRPRQVYVGSEPHDYQPRSERG